MTGTEFWLHTDLLQMNQEQWESICDGCAKCCLHQLEDEETEQLVFTDVACELLDIGTCRCSDYENRSERVTSCMKMTPNNVQEVAEYAPPSCAYRLLLEGRKLPPWHHLNSNDFGTIHQAGESVIGRVRAAADADFDRLEDYVVEWA